jgi:flagella basal body P-ring formation protein FlgA
MIWRLIPFILAGPAMADSVVATRMIRAQSVIAAEDIALVDAAIPGALTSLEGAIGQEAKSQIYPGRPVLSADVGAAAVIQRNQVVPLVFRKGGLAILTEARALGRAAPGELVEVLNLASRSKITGRVGPDGTVYVGQTP